jgi:hypothetical protein
MPYCEEAVRIALPKDKTVLIDSRGLAKACAGDTGGAIADFKEVLDESASNSDSGLSKRDIEMRTEFRKMLEAKPPKSVCTDQILKTLRDQFQ